MPKGTVDVAFIVGFWVIAAFFLSWMTTRGRDAATEAGGRDTFPPLG